MTSLRQTTDSIIDVLVRPNSPVNRVDGIHNERIKIFINAAPEKGKANRELIKFIASKTGIARSKITIISGEHSNYKRLMVKMPPGLDVQSVLLGIYKH